jgi:WD40-like Beta Propeller Repeat
MDDLRRRFAGLDRLRAPDLWDEVELRAAALGSTQRLTPVPVPVTRSRGASGRSLVVLLSALALLVALLAGAVAVGSGLVRLPAIIDRTLPVGLSGNGVIAVGKDGDILVADRPGGDLRPLVAGPENDRDPFFSPDGTKLAFMRWIDGECNLMVADADGTNVVELTRRPLEDCGYGWWNFAPDGRALIGVARIDGEYRVVHVTVDPGAAPTVLDVQLGHPDIFYGWGGPSFRPTNSQEIQTVAQLGPDGPYGLYVYDLATGDIRTIVEPAEQMPEHVAWLPDGEHITYSGHIVAADGSGDRVVEALGDWISPISNDGSRVVNDVVVADVPGDDSHQRSVVVPLDGAGEPVELACGLGREIACAHSWIWSPDDSMLIGTVTHLTAVGLSGGPDETSDTYLLADPITGQVSELDWVDVGTPAWQSVAP